VQSHETWEYATLYSSRRKHELGVVLGYQKSEELLKEGGGICPDGGVVVGGGGGMGRDDTASVTSIDGFGSDTQPIETGGILCEGCIGADRLSICEARVEDGGWRGSTATRQVEPEVRVFGTREVAAGANDRVATLGAIVW